jgi:hypothetical protein
MKRVLGIVTGLSASVLLFGASTTAAMAVQQLDTESRPTGYLGVDNLWDGISGNDTGGGFCDDASDDIFEALIVTGGWATRLDTDGNGVPRYTIFQPYGVVLEFVLETLGLEISDLNSHPAVVQGILADHIANGSFDEVELQDPDLRRITMRSGYMATISGASGSDASRTIYNNVYIDGSFIQAGAQYANGWLYCILGFIDSSPPIPPQDPLTVSWVSPSSPSASKYVLFELFFSRPLVTILNSQDFENLGSQPNCTMNPIPENGTQPSQRYYLLVTCPGFGTVQPSLDSQEVITLSNGLEEPEELTDPASGDVVDIVNGAVLRVRKSGDGQGTVTSNVSGIDCGELCFGVFSRQARITLTAQPAPGSIFVGWSGACSGTSPCRLTLSSSVDVTAQFELATRVVVHGVGGGTGSITSSPAAVNCSTTSGSSCSTTVRPGQQMTLTARASRGSRFVGWMGSCTRSGTCSIPAQSPGQSVHVFPVFERA